eukprot:12894605-Prorocentrum_lima.AAC.1
MSMIHSCSGPWQKEIKKQRVSCQGTPNQVKENGTISQRQPGITIRDTKGICPGAQQGVTGSYQSATATNGQPSGQ